MTRISRRSVLLGSAGLGLAACARTSPPETQNTPAAPERLKDGIETARAIANGETTAAAEVEAAIGRANQVNAKINAIANPLFVEARETALLPKPGPFSGVPSFIKDLADWQGAPTLYGSRAFRGYVAPGDNVFAKTWRDGGVIALGKSTTPEMGLISTTEPLVTGATRNPWDVSRTSGGSSGGAAALVAARVVPFAHASDGGGSIRIPAACCGVFGFKPSRGVTAKQVRPERQLEISVDHAVTISVRDSAALLAMSAVAERGLPFVREASTRRLKIGFMPQPATSAQTESAVVTGIESVATLCQDLGHEIIPFAPTLDGDQFAQDFLLYWSAGAAEFARSASAFSGQPIGPDILEPFTLGLVENFQANVAKFPETLQKLIAFQAEYEAWFDSFDVLLSPVVGQLPVPIGEQAPDGIFEEVLARVLDFAAFSAPMNVSGAPSMSVPLAWSESGLPIGAMFSAKMGQDEMLMALAYELETAQPWAQKLPGVVAR